MSEKSIYEKFWGGNEEPTYGTIDILPAGFEGLWKPAFDAVLNALKEPIAEIEIILTRAIALEDKGAQAPEERVEYAALVSKLNKLERPLTEDRFEEPDFPMDVRRHQEARETTRFHQSLRSASPGTTREGDAQERHQESKG